MLGRYWGKQCKNSAIIIRWSADLKKRDKVAKGKKSWKSESVCISEHKMGMKSGLLDNSSSLIAQAFLKVR